MYTDAVAHHDHLHQSIAFNKSLWKISAPKLLIYVDPSHLEEENASVPYTTATSAIIFITINNFQAAAIQNGNCSIKIPA